MTSTQAVLPLAFLACFLTSSSFAEEAPSESGSETRLEKGREDPVIRKAVEALLSIQEGEGEWPYEGVYRVQGKIPIGYRVGGTSIVADALLQAGPFDDLPVMEKVERALRFVLEGLDHPLMAPGTHTRYDVRIWGQTYALLFLCRVRDTDIGEKYKEAIEKNIPRLIETIVSEEYPAGGWNYSGGTSGGFVTASVLQALLVARDAGETVPQEVLERACSDLKKSRLENGAFYYKGIGKERRKTSRMDLLPGSIARSPICESTLFLFGESDTEKLQAAADAFYEHWEELEKRRKKTGTHTGPYGIAPYYVLYGHGYMGQLIELLPEEDRPRERKRLREVLLKTVDEDGTWNDRIFPRSRKVCTAFAILGLLGDRLSLPPVFEK